MYSFFAMNGTVPYFVIKSKAQRRGIAYSSTLKMFCIVLYVLCAVVGKVTVTPLQSYMISYFL